MTERTSRMAIRLHMSRYLSFFLSQDERYAELNCRRWRIDHSLKDGDDWWSTWWKVLFHGQSVCTEASVAVVVPFARRQTCRRSMENTANPYFQNRNPVETFRIWRVETFRACCSTCRPKGPNAQAERPSQSGMAKASLLFLGVGKSRSSKVSHPFWQSSCVSTLPWHWPLTRVQTPSCQECRHPFQWLFWTCQDFSQKRTFSFDGCSWLMVFHLGVASALVDRCVSCLHAAGLVQNHVGYELFYVLGPFWILWIGDYFSLSPAARDDDDSSVSVKAMIHQPLWKWWFISLCESDNSSVSVKVMLHQPLRWRCYVGIFDSNVHSVSAIASNDRYMWQRWNIGLFDSDASSA